MVTNAFKATIDALSDCESKKTCKRAVCSVSVFKAECIKYDVSSQPVSIHLPVSRLLAGKLWESGFLVISCELIIYSFKSIHLSYKCTSLCTLPAGFG